MQEILNELCIKKGLPKSIENKIMLNLRHPIAEIFENSEEIIIAKQLFFDESLIEIYHLFVEDILTFNGMYDISKMEWNIEMEWNNIYLVRKKNFLKRFIQYLKFRSSLILSLPILFPLQISTRNILLKYQHEMLCSMENITKNKIK